MARKEGLEEHEGSREEADLDVAQQIVLDRGESGRAKDIYRDPNISTISLAHAVQLRTYRIE